ncbi:hypothetical protein A8H39_09940 [Paraburkholderia fungorum]|nr:hypothetical protein A8H39_09940 [Paraburkholderia fungorum]
MAAQAAAQFGTALFGGGQAPEVSTSTPFNPFTVDNSGWAVNFGSGTATAAPNPVSTLAQGLANTASNLTGGGSGGTDPLLIVILAAVAIVALKKK